MADAAAIGREGVGFVTPLPLYFSIDSHYSVGSTTGSGEKSALFPDVTARRVLGKQEAPSREEKSPFDGVFCFC